MLGWRTILQLLAAESIAFSVLHSVPDRNASWSRAEDDLLVQAVAKCSTSNILGRDWIEVAWEMPGRLPQQCQECYRLAHICAELTFVFLRVTFRGSPLVPSAQATSLERTHPATSLERTLCPRPHAPPHAHAARYRMHTSSGFFFATVPPFGHLLQALRPIVFLTAL